MGWTKWVGISLILFSGVWFALILIVPFAALSIVIKALLGVVFFALMEIFFWAGSVIVGKQAISHFWARFKKSKAESTGSGI